MPNIFYNPKINKNESKIKDPFFIHCASEGELISEKSIVLIAKHILQNIFNCLNKNESKIKDTIFIQCNSKGKLISGKSIFLVVNNGSNYSSEITKIDFKRYKKREKYKYLYNNKKYLLRCHGKNYFANNKKVNPNFKNKK